MRLEVRCDGSLRNGLVSHLTALIDLRDHRADIRVQGAACASNRLGRAMQSKYSFSVTTMGHGVFFLLPRRSQRFRLISKARMLAGISRGPCVGGDD